MASRLGAKGKRRPPPLLVHLIGLAGLACLVLAIVGLALSGGRGQGTPASPSAELAAAAQERPAPSAPGTETVSRPADSVAASEPVAVTPSAPPEIRPAEAQSYYPLEVGRYWTYHYEGGAESVKAEIERYIERTEHRGGHDLYFFADGTVVYFEDGRIYEMGPEGGVNVIPVDVERDDSPYVYHSEGMQIEKRLGARDTTVIVGNRRFEGCLEVITKFRSLDTPTQKSLAYSSYFAKGIGLVGRQRWPKTGDSDLSLILAGYGVKGM